MIVNLQLSKDKQGKILEQPSDYQPSKDIRERTLQVIQDYTDAWAIRNRPFEEFNNLSLVDRINLDRTSYNQYIFGDARDAADAWKSRAFRPIVRNKIITIAAHITASVIYPKIYAQNDNDMEDQDAAMVMRDLIEWANDQADYDKNFIEAVVNALVDPISIIHTEYAQKFREIKEYIHENEDEYMEEDEVELESDVKTKKKWKIKKILDELYSGFQDCIVLPDEFFIGNPYEPEVQKQPFIIWRKVIDYATAKAKYGDNPIFRDYVKPGMQFLYSDDQEMFYEVYDEDLQDRMVEEVIYYNREADLQLTFVNGILLDDVDTPNPRKDKRYPFATSGYERFNSRFFYFKSLAFKLGPDEEVVNTLYRMIIDGTYLQIMPPSVVFGNEEISSDVIAPGVVTTISNDTPNASWQTLATNNNLTAGLTMLQKVESSIDESSADALQTGQAVNGSQTAFEISRLEQNARVMLGLFGKMIGFMVRDLGVLRVGDILQFMTVGEVMELETGAGKLRFKNFVLPDKTIDGKKKSRVIRFDGELPDEMTEEEIEEMSMEIKKEQYKLGDNAQICLVNPSIFRKIKYKIRIIPEALFPKSDALKKALNLEGYALAMNNPLTNKEAITRDMLLSSFDQTKDDPDKYLQQPETSPDAAILGQESQGKAPTPEQGRSSVLATEGADKIADLTGTL